MITIIALIIGLFFAMNIGVSGAAASMGITYGTGVINKPRVPLILFRIRFLMKKTVEAGKVLTEKNLKLAKKG